MLVLTRRVGEEILIGQDIRVMVVGVRGNSVRIGIAAPPGIIVDREEIHKRRSEKSCLPDRALAALRQG
jgi:carbon storage regulator